ncbi:MAG: glycoside hydrolase family 127 protein [Candidatus Aminicenantales bacterium]
MTGGPLKRAQDAMAKILLGLEPDRMLAGYRIRAGLEPKAKGYGGWDRVDERQLTGHVAGHYLSAVSLMYAATGNEEFRRRAEYIVDEFETVQKANGNGYLGALMGYRPGPEGGPGTGELVDARELLEMIADDVIIADGTYWEYLNGVWAPWYVFHKTSGGLRDAYRILGLRKALVVEIKFAEWAVGVVKPLSEEKRQRMLDTEFGGMGEIMVDLYADTGDPRWLEASDYWEQRAFIEPLRRHEDVLAGKHGNAQMPKLITAADRYACTGAAADIVAASFFWDTVVHHHTFATGGHGNGEFFASPDRFSEYVDGRTCETCNVYNMLRLTRRLFEFGPDARYADFQERALFNHVLASLDPETGSASYMVPVGLGVRQEYESDMLDGSFTCCVCSAMESHGMHAHGLYYENGGTLWVNAYVPSTVNWTGVGMSLAMETGFPEGETATLRVTGGEPREFTLALRRPGWTGEGFTVKVNGNPVALAPAHWMKQERRGPAWYRDPQVILGDPVSDYVELRRTWRAGDTIEVTLPKSLRLEPTPDNPNRTALRWGPLVLAGDVTEWAAPSGGRRRGRNLEPSPYPVFLAAAGDLTERLKPVPGEPGRFRTDGVGRSLAKPEAPAEVSFAPFYRTHRRTYGIYWELVDSADWSTRSKAASPEERRLKLEAATLAYVRPGETPSESDFDYRSGVEREVVSLDGRKGRGGSGWLSYTLPIGTTAPLSLVVTYNNREQGEAEFNIMIDGTVVGLAPLKYPGEGFFDIEYSIPAGLVRGKENVTVRFEAAGDKRIAAVFGIRLIRADTKSGM